MDLTSVTVDPVNRQHTSSNIPLRAGTKTDLWNKIMKEVWLSRFAGPYKEEDFPFSEFVQSPVRLVPKSGNKTRLIFHLSYNFGDKMDERSIIFILLNDCVRSNMKIWIQLCRNA